VLWHRRRDQSASPALRPTRRDNLTCTRGAVESKEPELTESGFCHKLGLYQREHGYLALWTRGVAPSMDDRVRQLNSVPCVFCATAAHQTPAGVALEDPHTLAFLDVFPANPGHSLVIPKRPARPAGPTRGGPAARDEHRATRGARPRPRPAARRHQPDPGQPPRRLSERLSFPRAHSRALGGRW